MKSPAATKLTNVARVLGIPPEEIDRITRGQISGELPPFRIYLRTKYRLTAEEIRQVEEVFDRVRRDREDITEALQEDGHQA
jgi:hypothetical protein